MCIIIYVHPLSPLSEFFPRLFKDFSLYLTRSTCPGVYPVDEMPAAEVFSFVWGTVSLFHLLFPLVCCCLFPTFPCPVNWGCRIHWLHKKRVFWYDSKQSDGEVPLMLELWGMRSTQNCHCSKVHSVFMLNWIVWNRSALTWNCTYAKLNCLK